LRSEYYANPSPLQDFSAFGGESAAQFSERVTAAFVERIWDRHSTEPVTVVVVCHAETINALLIHLLGAPYDGWLSFSIEHTAVSHVDVRHGRPRIRFVNDHSHLGDLSRGHRGRVGGEEPRAERRV
jgi:broad specificity phosphatase PhoE